MLAKELEIREAARFGESEGIFFREAPLPLDNLDANILCADALFPADETPIAARNVQR